MIFKQKLTMCTLCSVYLFSKLMKYRLYKRNDFSLYDRMYTLTVIHIYS